MGLQKNEKEFALAGNRTRVNCLEGSYAHHYTTNALMVQAIWKWWQLTLATEGVAILHYNDILYRLRGAMVARLTPDQKAACSSHVGVIILPVKCIFVDAEKLL